MVIVVKGTRTIVVVTMLFILLIYRRSEDGGVAHHEEDRVRSSSGIPVSYFNLRTICTTHAYEEYLCEEDRFQQSSRSHSGEMTHTVDSARDASTWFL